MDELKKEWELTINKWSKIGFEALSETEKTWLSLRSLIDSYDNGGLISYYYNSGADDLNYCIKALKKFSESDILSAIERINDLFPNSKVPSDIDDRNDVIDSWPDDDSIDNLLREIDDNLIKSMERLQQKLNNYIINKLNLS